MTRQPNSFTFTAILLLQGEPRWAEALETDLQVVTDVRAASIVVQALIGVCREGSKLVTAVLNLFYGLERPTFSASPYLLHSWMGSSEKSLQSGLSSHSLSVLMHSPLWHRKWVGPSHLVTAAGRRRHIRGGVGRDGPGG